MFNAPPKRPPTIVKTALAAPVSIAIATAALLLSAVMLTQVHAQTRRGQTIPVPESRNLPPPADMAPKTGSAQRVALVIGNSAYKDAPLSNPVNDARAIAKVLQESGFGVILRENSDQRSMLSALREFGDRLRGGRTGLFYYAGHGMQIKGRNYLIPVGASIEREDEVAYSAVDAQAVLDKMETAGNLTNIMILDACRNNPFLRSSRSAQGGLAQMDAPIGTLVAYATSPGAVASDGSGDNGLYTQHLLTAIRQPNSRVEDVFKQVRSHVRRDSQGKQVPWESTSLEGDFYFRGGPAAPVPVNPGAGLEAALWDAVKDSQVPAELRAYLNRFPQGQFVAEAVSRLAKLQPSPAAASARVPALPGMPTSADAAMRSAGAFQVGDRWRFQIVDKFKGEVVGNYARSVEAVLQDGTLVLNKGSVRWSALGNLQYDRNPERERTFSAGYANIPVALKAGAKTTLNYEVDKKYANGHVEKEHAEGTMVVKAQEAISTPAGEFTAWRVVMDVFWQTQGTSSRGRWVFTGWYVPALRTYVAFEDESRKANGTFIRRDRHELTSYSVRGAEHLAQR
jgi:hypothetical protein